MNGYLRAEISLSAIRHNVKLITGLLAPGVKFCPVIKADAYRHGVGHVLSALGSAPDMLAVAVCSEALQLRDLNWQGPVLVLISARAYSGDDLVELIARDVTLTVASAAEIDLLTQAARKARRPGKLHVKIDTGMTRSGCLPEQAPGLVRAARQADSLRLGGIYTHFACAEEADKTSARRQLQLFLEAVDRCGGREGVILHAANSAAVIDLPQTHLDMVRPGISLCGYQPSETLHNVLPLRPSLRLTAPIVLIKDVPAGTSTGYGMTYTFAKPARVALVPVGYADGYSRDYSDLACMRVNGVDCPVRGRVSMDQTVIEITNVPEATAGQQVEVISNDPAAANSVAGLARLAETIPHEVVTRLGNRITRVAVA